MTTPSPLTADPTALSLDPSHRFARLMQDLKLLQRSMSRGRRADAAAPGEPRLSHARFSDATWGAAGRRGDRRDWAV